MNIRAKNKAVCGGKKKFMTWKQAQTHLNSIRKGGAIRRTGRRFERLHPYRCQYCGYFHTGHYVSKLEDI